MRARSRFARPISIETSTKSTYATIPVLICKARFKNPLQPKIDPQMPSFHHNSPHSHSERNPKKSLFVPDDAFFPSPQYTPNRLQIQIENENSPTESLRRVKDMKYSGLHFAF
jgi:hypothetical protein